MRYICRSSFIGPFQSCMHAKSLQSYLVLCDLWTLACQASLSIGFSRQEYWNGLPCPSPGDLPDPGIEPVTFRSPALAGWFFTISATWEAQCCQIALKAAATTIFISTVYESLFSEKIYYPTFGVIPI